MKPFDPRLLRHARSARAVLATGAVFGFVRTLAIIAWCWVLAHSITALALPVLGGAGGASGRIGEGNLGLDALPLLLLCALAALSVRALTGWAMETAAARGAVRVKSQLRSCALKVIDAHSPEWVAQRSDTKLATVLGRGLDALDGYFSGYVPQLILTAISTPLLILSVLLTDPVSGITVVIVFPVIPVFMILIGLATQAVQDRQWAQLQQLSSSFLDIVSGLATLRIFRRETKQAERISRETDEYRSRTMKVLRVTFLSGFVLDLAGTFSIALVAVTVGTRLVNGDFPLALGLFVLLLLPEVFIPIRQVGAAFHSSTEGLSASADVFDIIESAHQTLSPASMNGRAWQVSPAIICSHLTVTRQGHHAVGPISFEVAPGELVALTGPSGAGKSTVLSALLGFVEVSSGSLSRPEELACALQRPGLLQGTVRENVTLGQAADRVDDELVRLALDAVGLSTVAPEKLLSVAGFGLSGGQAQRVSIARCLYRAWVRDAGAIVVDEPSSALDAYSEARVAQALRREADAGRAVLVITHRLALINSADRVVRVEAPTLLTGNALEEFAQ